LSEAPAAEDKEKEMVVGEAFEDVDTEATIVDDHGK